MFQNMKKTFLFALTGISAAAVALGATISGSPASVFAQYSPATAGTWVHYSQSLPGEAAGAPNGYGVREYWVQCGGGYQFTAPTSGTIVDNETNYDFTGFTSNDPRYIIPIVEGKGEFKSVLFDITASAANFNEISEMTSGGFTTTDSLPSVGESKQVLWVKDATTPAYYATTYGVTKVFKTFAEMNSVIPMTSGKNYAKNEYFGDGNVYVFGANLTITGNINTVYDSSLDKTRGFAGMVDGRGHNLIGSATYYNGGLFQFLNGATIKNINFTNITLTNYNSTVLCVQSHDSILSNLNFEFASINSEHATSYSYGAIVGKYMTDTLIENIKVTLASSVATNFLFGVVSNDYSNSYDNILCTADSYVSVSSIGSSGIETDAIQKGYNFVPRATTLIDLDRQDIHVNSAGTLSLSTGNTNVGTVTSISVVAAGNSYDLGSNLSNLTIPDELKTTESNHGQALVTITNSESETFALPVTLVTEYISANSDLSLLRGTNLEKEIYGYYALSANISANYNAVNAAQWPGIGPTTDTNWNTTSGNGFYGELDGRGYTITGNISSANNGIIPALRYNAVVKNLNVFNSTYTGWGNATLFTGPSGYNVKNLAKVYNIKVTAELRGNNTSRTDIIAEKYINNILLQNISVTTTKGTTDDKSTDEQIATFNFSLFPANYLTAASRMNHVVFNTFHGASARIIDGIDDLPPGAVINYLD